MRNRMNKRIALFLSALLLTCVTSEAKYGGGSGTSSDPYLINDINTLIQLSKSPGHWDKCYRFSADIDMAEDTNNEFKIIGGFVVNRPRDIKVDSNEKKVYWADDTFSCIYRTDTDGGNMETVISKEIALPVSIDLDVKAKRIYWSNFRNKSIQRADLNGSNVETVVSSNVNNPYGIALDTTRGRIYWVEPYDNQIRSTNLDGMDLRIINGPRFSWGIAIDEINGFIYWSESGRIVRSNLDGTSPKVVVSNISHPYGIALDISAGKIYWAQFEGVYYANLDGSNIVNLAHFSLDYMYNIGLGFSGPDVYWTNLSLIFKLNSSTNYFIKNWTTGSFDGDGHKISNLNLKVDSDSMVGFLGMMGTNGECKNIVLVEPNITALASYCVGSLAGSSRNITNCAVLGGNIRGSENVGGLVGRTSGTIKNCSTTAVNVSGNTSVGALVGTIDGMYAGTIEECRSDGNVFGNSQVGGLMGDSGGYVRNCYSTANVSGNSAVGGFIGFGWGSVENSYSQGRVTGTTDTGGFLGKNQGVVSNCFWDIETSGQASSAGAATGKTTAEMKTQNTLESAGWDFNTPVWVMWDGHEYPWLAWEHQPVEVNGISVVERNRVGRTMFRYVCRLGLKSTRSINIWDVNAELTNVPENVTIVDGNVGCAFIEPFGTAESNDTFEIEVDRSTLIEPAEMTWHISYSYDDGTGRTIYETATSTTIFEQTADITGDGKVNIDDLALLVSKWLWQGQPGEIIQDIYQDGRVDLLDLCELATNWAGQ